MLLLLPLLVAEAGLDKERQLAAQYLTLSLGAGCCCIIDHAYVYIYGLGVW